MKKKEPEDPKVVTHYMLTAKSYKGIIDLLSQMPYNQIVSVMNDIQKSTTPIYDDNK